jgi:large subunit ribosomal protein L24
MKTTFSTSWKASKQPRKQRKYRMNAPLNIQRKFLSVNLSKPLRKKVNKRNIVVRKGDIVKIMRGKFKGKSGKVEKVLIKYEKVYIEKISVKKSDGSQSNVPLKPSNLQIIELKEDKKRFAKETEVKEDKSKKETETKTTKKTTKPKKTDKQENKK